MVMAAGLGKRMRPLTATRPKPLVEVDGKALLDHVLDKLRAAGVKKVVVNVHYLADALEAHLASRGHGLEIVISDERKPADGNRRRSGPGGAADRLPTRSSRSTATICGSTGRPTPCKLLASHWDGADGRAAAARAAGARAQPQRPGRLPHGPRRPHPPPRAQPRRAVRLHRHPDRLQAAARATRPRGRSRPTSCGTARSRRGAASARSIRACGSTSARPQSIPHDGSGARECLTRRGSPSSPSRRIAPSPTRSPPA